MSPLLGRIEGIFLKGSGRGAFQGIRLGGLSAVPLVARARSLPAGGDGVTDRGRAQARRVTGRVESARIDPATTRQGRFKAAASRAAAGLPPSRARG